MTDEELRLAFRKLKETQKIKYKEVAAEFDFTPKSFSSWLNGNSNTNTLRKRVMEDYLRQQGGI